MLVGRLRGFIGAGCLLLVGSRIAYVLPIFLIFSYDLILIIIIALLLLHSHHNLYSKI